MASILPFQKYPHRMMAFSCIDETEALGLHAVLSSQENEIRRTVCPMHHGQTAAVFQKVAACIKYFFQRGIQFVAGTGHSPAFAHFTASHFPIGRVHHHQRKRTGGEIVLHLPVVAGHHVNHRFLPVSFHVSFCQIRHDGIHFQGRNVPAAQGRHEKGDDAGAGAQVADFIFSLDGGIMGQEHGIDGEAELVRPLDEFHAIPHQVVQPLSFF